MPDRPERRHRRRRPRSRRDQPCGILCISSVRIESLKRAAVDGLRMLFEMPGCAVQGRDRDSALPEDARPAIIRRPGGQPAPNSSDGEADGSRTPQACCMCPWRWPAAAPAEPKRPARPRRRPHSSAAPATARAMEVPVLEGVRAGGGRRDPAAHRAAGAAVLAAVVGLSAQGRAEPGVQAADRAGHDHLPQPVAQYARTPSTSSCSATSSLPAPATTPTYPGRSREWS